MNFWNSLAVGLREIWSHKFRSFLTMLGVILGVASLLSTFALTDGMAKTSRPASEASRRRMLRRVSSARAIRVSSSCMT